MCFLDDLNRGGLVLSALFLAMAVAVVGDEFFLGLCLSFFR